jgi:hypothetical protein
MKTSVPNRVRPLHVHTFNPNKAIMLSLLLIMTLAVQAQTFTTIAPGNWNSPSTWSGGSVPNRDIAAGRVVIIRHDVNFNFSSDLIVRGQLRIETGGVLRFAPGFDKKISMYSTGLLHIKSGSLLQNLPDVKSTLEMDGGRILVESGRLEISGDIKAKAAVRRTYRNSVIKTGRLYELDGTSSAKAIDSIINSTVEVGVYASGDFDCKNYSSLFVSNAKLMVQNGNFKTSSNSEIVALSGAVANFGIDILKVKGNLQNDGAWNARVDAYCVDGSITGSAMAAIDFTRPEDCTLTSVNSAPAPEFTFSNPILVSGTANQEGAVYRFNNIASGTDALIRLKKFSRPDIVMQNIDLATMGWGKAFQPQFGLPGVVQPFQNWYIDFEMEFLQGGTNNPKTLPKVDLTALDVDGDGWSISEYASFEAPSNIVYSTVTYLQTTSNISAGQNFTCPRDNIASTLVACSACDGDGKSGTWNYIPCTACDATGLKYSTCNHAYEGVSANLLTGPVENFNNIDTMATQVMATYQYVQKQKIKFRYGARSANNSSNGSGIRLNSLWFRQFNLAPLAGVLPVTIQNFEAKLQQGHVALNWSVMEKDFSHYILQRSEDGKVYRDAGMIFSRNNGAGYGEYQYKDKNLSSSTNTIYYRLVMVDKTGEGTYSAVKVVRLNKEQSLQLSVYPNPVSSQLQIAIPANWQNKPVMIEVISMSGMTVKAIQSSSAQSTEVIAVDALSKGSYVLRVRTQNESAQQKFIKN